MRVQAILLVLSLASSPVLSVYFSEAYTHPIYYRKFGFPSRPLKHGPTPKIDKEVLERIRSFIDPFYVQRPLTYEEIKPYLKDKGIDYPDLRAFHPNIIG